jgi:hypothetical protein
VIFFLFSSKIFLSSRVSISLSLNLGSLLALSSISLESLILYSSILYSSKLINFFYSHNATRNSSFSSSFSSIFASLSFSIYLAFESFFYLEIWWSFALYQINWVRNLLLIFAFSILKLIRDYSISQIWVVSSFIEYS